MIFQKDSLIAFKRVVMHSEGINGSVDTDETVIAKILNKNQWAIMEKCWCKQNNEVMMETFYPILIIWVNS